MYDEDATTLAGRGQRQRADRHPHPRLGRRRAAHAELPDLPGIETFEGETFHSAQWRHDLDLTGRNVAVIGTGASAIQFVPQIAPDVAQLDLYQRSAAWVTPKPNPRISAEQAGRLRPASASPARDAGRGLLGARSARHRVRPYSQGDEAPGEAAPGTTCTSRSPTLSCGPSSSPTTRSAASASCCPTTSTRH